MTNVKGVDMLDLNEAEISNKSIRLISKLEYVKELRAKRCHHTNLKTLMFSADDVEAIKEKLLQLKTMLRNYELLINVKP